MLETTKTCYVVVISDLAETEYSGLMTAKKGTYHTSRVFAVILLKKFIKENRNGRKEKILAKN